MMSTRQDRGAVNIIFLIITLVIGLAGWVSWYLQFSGNEKLVNEKTAAETEQGREAMRGLYLRDAFNELARVTGGDAGIPKFSTTAITVPPQESWAEEIAKIIKSAEAELAGAKNLFNAGATTTSLMEISAPANQIINGLRGQISTLTGERDTQRKAREAAETANTTLLTSHSDALRTKNGEVNDVRNRLNAQLQQSENNHEKTTSLLRDKSAELETATTEYRGEVQTLRDKMNRLDASVAQLKAPSKIKRARQNPDGKVTSVNPRSGMAWINIGSRKMVRRGTRFETFAVRKGGVKVRTGFVEVHDIERDRSLCKVEGGAISGGDLIYNPFFDPDGPKIFFFLGSFTGSFDNQEAAAILKSYGATVADKLSLHVDFVVLGANPDPDAEVGPDADVNWFKNTTEYNDSLRWGIETIRARDLATYLQYD